MKKEINEIKKALYKEKPTAHRFIGDGDTSAYSYVTNMSLGVLTFKVPMSEMGMNVFENKMPAQLLIRWLI